MSAVGLPSAAAVGAPRFDRLLFAALIALAGLTLLWEAWLAPIRPGGSWLVLKAAPILIALPGLVRGRRYTAQWLSLVLPFYAAEGIVRAWSESGRVPLLASGELILAVLAFILTLFVARGRREITRRRSGNSIEDEPAEVRRCIRHQLVAEAQ